MLTSIDFHERRRSANHPEGYLRCTGKSFRCLLEAAHAVSVGDRVVVWCVNHQCARRMASDFLELFHRHNYHRTTRCMLRHLNTDGFVLFKALPESYPQYVQAVRGNNTLDLFDC